MAFLLQNISRTGHQANASAFWSFRSNDDDMATIQATGYFDEMAGTLNRGDWLMLGDSSDVHTLSYVVSNTGVTPVVIATGLVVTA